MEIPQSFVIGLVGEWRLSVRQLSSFVGLKGITPRPTIIIFIP
jgi:hypothetical protein